MLLRPWPPLAGRQRAKRWQGSCASVAPARSPRRAWQAAAGVGYSLSEALHLSLGWRYVNLGVTKADLIDTVGNKIGSIESDVGAHEFTVGFRYAFWRVPLFDDRE